MYMRECVNVKSDENNRTYLVHDMGRNRRDLWQLRVILDLARYYVRRSRARLPLIHVVANKPRRQGDALWGKACHVTSPKRAKRRKIFRIRRIEQLPIGNVIGSFRKVLDMPLLSSGLRIEKNIAENSGECLFAMGDNSTFGYNVRISSGWENFS